MTRAVFRPRWQPAFWLLLLLILLSSGCGRAPEAVYHEQLFAFGTLVDIRIAGAGREQAAAGVRAVDSLFQQQHRDWHAWQRGALDDLNRAIASGQAWTTDASIATLVRLGQDFERKSGGRFNPAIGGLLALWGFQQDEPAGPPPAHQAIEAWLEQAPSSLDLQLEGQRVHSNNPYVRLDFGGFAKGYSVGRAVEVLRARGLENFIVNAGGDLCLAGTRQGEPWHIGIRHPDGGVLAALPATGPLCVFTSGDYERYYTYQGRRYHHVLDPRTGYPAQGARSVTVLAADPALADAAATALMVADKEHWPAVAVEMDIPELLRVEYDGSLQLTPGLAARLEFRGSLPAMRVVALDQAGPGAKGPNP
ncbi:MAG TPA: FAD:protein FMN transferase [Gammaproteobacteria bacterium]|nr:FAD:protein FMN transferase [Gammaproteobacteria bacterium]